MVNTEQSSFLKNYIFFCSKTKNKADRIITIHLEICTMFSNKNFFPAISRSLKTTNPLYLYRIVPHQKQSKDLKIEIFCFCFQPTSLVGVYLTEISFYCQTWLVPWDLRCGSGIFIREIENYEKMSQMIKSRLCF